MRGLIGGVLLLAACTGGTEPSGVKADEMLGSISYRPVVPTCPVGQKPYPVYGIVGDRIVVYVCA